MKKNYAEFVVFAGIDVLDGRNCTSLKVGVWLFCTSLAAGCLLNFVARLLHEVLKWSLNIDA